jgi:hypothetical protein
MGIISIPVRAVLKIVHRLSRRLSKLPNFLEKVTQRCDDRAAVDTYIVDSSMYIKHIINPVHHWIKILGV